MGDKTKVQVSKLKPGRYILIDGEPCRIGNITVSSPGKHGSAKARIERSGSLTARSGASLNPPAPRLRSR